MLSWRVIGVEKVMREGGREAGGRGGVNALGRRRGWGVSEGGFLKAAE